MIESHEWETGNGQKLRLRAGFYTWFVVVFPQSPPFSLVDRNPASAPGFTPGFFFFFKKNTLLPLLCRALTDSSSLYLLGTHYEHTRNTLGTPFGRLVLPPLTQQLPATMDTPDVCVTYMGHRIYGT